MDINIIDAIDVSDVSMFSSLVCLLPKLLPIMNQFVLVVRISNSYIRNVKNVDFGELCAYLSAPHNIANLA